VVVSDRSALEDWLTHQQPPGGGGSQPPPDGSGQPK